MKNIYLVRSFLAIIFVILVLKSFYLMKISALPRPCKTAGSGDNGNEVPDDDSSEENDCSNLPIASIKSRAIAMDPDLCRSLSRYHPHYPTCYDYCTKLGHWMGMCIRKSCHCYS